MTTLSEQDLELAKKHGEMFKEDDLVEVAECEIIFTKEQLAAFLAERDERMKIQYWTRDLLYELESRAMQIGKYTPEFMRLIVEAKVAFQRDTEEREEQVRLLKKELLAIHEVVQCIGCVKEVLPTDSVTVKGVKIMAIRLNEDSDKESEDGNK